MRNPSPTPSKSSSSTTPCCSKVGLKRGPWTPEEDELLSSYIKREGEGKWRTLPKKAGLLRCGKSCRLRWMNYLKPTIKRGDIGEDEEDLIVRLHRLLGNRWSLIAGRIPGRTDNEIKNYWNTHLSKKLMSQGLDPRTHKPLNPNQTMIPPNPNLDPNPTPNPLSIQETTTNTTSNIGGCSMDGVSDDLYEFMEEDMFQQHNSDINAYNINYGSPVPSFGHGAFWEDIMSSFSDFF